VAFRAGGFAARSTTAVHDVSFDLFPGETLGLVGESGSGKSTLARAIVGLVACHGEVLLDEEPVDPLSWAGRRRLRRSVQMVFQDPGGSLNPRMRVLDAVAEPRVVQGMDRPAAARRAAGDLLRRCGIDPAMGDRYPHQFSGGQRQRIAIARALAPEPRVLLCDEPTSALDVSVQAQILNLLVQVQQERGLSILLITHDLGVVRHMAHRIGVMRAGSLVELGPREQVLAAPVAAYTRALLDESPDPYAALADTSSAS
jgi:ABC-type glutathione transport system ATPase component